MIDGDQFLACNLSVHLGGCRQFSRLQQACWNEEGMYTRAAEAPSNTPLSLVLAQ